MEHSNCKKLSIRGLMTLALFLTFLSVARADRIDALTLVSSGSNTNFAITGTYAADTPASPFSSPNADYSLIFTLPTSPVSFAFLDDVDGIFGLDTSVLLNGVTFDNSQVVFFTQAQGGGLVVCLSQDCGPTEPPAPNSWDIFGDQVFSGPVSSPTFISGTPNFDASQSVYNITPTPEPPALALLAAGLLGIGVEGRRKNQRA
jgi:hypothetical protein